MRCRTLRFAAVSLLARSKMVSPGTCMTELYPACGSMSVVRSADCWCHGSYRLPSIYPSIGVLVFSFNRDIQNLFFDRFILRPTCTTWATWGLSAVKILWNRFSVWFVLLVNKKYSSIDRNILTYSIQFLFFVSTDALLLLLFWYLVVFQCLVETKKVNFVVTYDENSLS